MNYHNDRAITKFRIFTALSDSEGGWGEAVYEYGAAGAASISGRQVFSFDPRNARFVKVEIDEAKPNHARIDELEVFGKYACDSAP